MDTIVKLHIRTPSNFDLNNHGVVNSEDMKSNHSVRNYWHLIADRRKVVLFNFDPLKVTKLWSLLARLLGNIN